MDEYANRFAQELTDALEQFYNSQEDYEEDQSQVVFNACFMGSDYN